MALQASPMLFDSHQQIDLDELKKNHVRLYYFGLGFIQLKIDDTYRLHFYSPDLPAITEDIHNHRYHFYSKVLKGQIINHHYTVGDSDCPTHEVSNESCNPDISAPKLNQLAKVTKIGSVLFKQGDICYTPSHLWHTVEIPQGQECITLLKRGPYRQEYAQIVTPMGKSSVCPFSKKIDDAALWKIIAEMLK